MWCRAALGGQSVMQSRIYWGLLGLAAFVGLSDGGFKSENGLTIAEQPHRVVFRWSGVVGPDMLKQFEDAFQARQADQRPILISLHSNGGNVQQGGNVVDLIRRVQRTKTVDTLIDAKSYCASMCVPIFMAGTRRSAERKARFMFHEVSFGRSPVVDQERRRITKELKLASSDARLVEKMMISSATDFFFERYLEPNGVDPRWIAKIRKSIDGRDVWLTAEQLVAQRSGVVDEFD